MNRLIRVSLPLLVVLLLSPATARAHTLLSELLLKALLSDIELAPTTGHQAHFQPVVQPGEIASGFEVNQLEIPLGINSIIAAQVSTIPLGSSSGGFAYRYDSTLGTFTRQSGTFGSAFAERALTGGRGRWNAGVNFQRASYDTLEGKDLRNGDLRVYLVHADCCGARNTPGAPPTPFYEGDIIGNSLSMRLTSSTFSTFLNYGVTDRFDVGLVVPIVTLTMELDVQSQVIRLATEGNPAIHAFPGGEITRTISEDGRSQGIGDLLLRGKYRFLDAAGGGLAFGVDVRLPTGDAEQLLGTGGTQTKLMVIASMESAKFSPHVNVGYTISAGGGVGGGTLAVAAEPADEFNYAAGFDTAAHERLTVSFDIIGRTLRDLGRMVPVQRQFAFTTQAGTFGFSSFEEFTRRPGDLSLVSSAVGVRFNPRGNLLISAHVLLPISKGGLRDKVTPILGVDYSF